MSPRAERVHPHQALAVYAEPLAAGRRVVVFADAASGLAELVEDLGAQSVVLVTPDDDVEQLERLRATRFDLALVADLGRFAEPAELLAGVRRMLGDSGAAVVSAANRDAVEQEGEDEDGGPPGAALDYYALFDLVAREFADVRMVAELPFHGVALAEVGDESDSPAVSVDTQLADADRTPRAFVAVASQRGAGLDPYCIVELPSAAFEDEPVEEEGRAAEADLEDARAAVAELAERERAREEREKEREREREQEREAARVREARHEAERESLRAQLEQAREALRAQLEGSREALRAHVEESRAREQALAAHVPALQGQAARVSDLERELVARARIIAELSTEVEKMRSAAEAGAIAAAQVEALALRAERAERALAQAEPELARTAEAHAAELQRFEDALRERAQAVRRLEVEVTRRERMVRELVETLAEQGLLGGPEEGHRVPFVSAPTPEHAPTHAPAPAPANAPVPAPAPAPDRRESATVSALAADNAHLQQKLDGLAMEVARREADAQASAWTIAELERRLTEARPGGPAGSGGQVELDALRRALAQEHEARVRAESGEELVRARAEIQRQSALLAQAGLAPGAEAGAQASGPEELR